MAYTTIDKSDDYFNTVLYTGNGTDATSITGVGFQPDWVWVKERSSTSSHKIADSVRGATKEIESNNTGAEGTNSAGLQSFDSDGFTLGTSVAWNENTQTYVSWNWLASNTTASNTDGDITSTVSANTTSGFSIVKWTGNGTSSDQEIGTGLSEELKFVISKPLASGGATDQWLVYVNGVTDAQDNCLLLNSTSALVTSASGGTPNKGTTAGNLLIKAGTATNNNLNNSGTDYIAYCFAEKKGFSKFGSYTGNGNADGTFVYTGFKPAFVIVKNTGALENWHIVDNKINPFNPMDTNLFTNISNAEVTASGSTGYDIDFLANGFKVRTSDSTFNTSGGSYIYMAFAENPFVTSTGIAGLAR